MSTLFSRFYRKPAVNKTLHVVGLNASPRLQGNCALLLSAALAAAEQAGCRTTSIMLNDLAIRPCQACATPAANGTCVFNDDMQRVYAAIDSADAVILASPVYFGSVSAQAKLMIDRYQCRWQLQHQQPKATPLRRGAFFCVQAGTRDDFFANSRAVVKNWFATINTEYAAELMCPGFEAAGSIAQSPQMLEQARQIARKLIAQPAALVLPWTICCRSGLGRSSARRRRCSSRQGRLQGS